MINRFGRALLMVCAIIAAREGTLPANKRLVVDEAPTTEATRHGRRKRSRIVHDELTDPEFKCKYRVTKTVFNIILSLIEHDLAHGHNKMPPHLQLGMFLEHCGHGVGHRMLCLQYGCTRRGCSKFIDKVSRCLIRLDLVKWPSLDEQAGLAREYNQYQPLFDGVIGSVDGTHVMVCENGERKQYFINRKNWPSVSLMCVCDINLRFTHITYEAPGRCHDARVFTMSDLPTLLNDPSKTRPYYYIFGDAAYGNRARVLVPTEVETTVGESRFTHTHAHTHTHTHIRSPTRTHTHTHVQVQLRTQQLPSSN